MAVKRGPAGTRSDTGSPPRPRQKASSEEARQTSRAAAEKFDADTDALAKRLQADTRTSSSTEEGLEVPISLARPIPWAEVNRQVENAQANKTLERFADELGKEQLALDVATAAPEELLEEIFNDMRQAALRATTPRDR